MENRITITLDEYLNEGYEIPATIDNFAALPTAIYNLGTDWETLFIRRNRYKEIGSETEELFFHNLSVLIDEAIVKFNPLLKLYIANYEDLTKRTVLEHIEGDSSGDGDTKNYLNPANTNAEKLTDRTANHREGTYSEDRDRSFGFFKSNAEIVEAAQKVNTVALDILKYLDKAFIGEY